MIVEPVGNEMIVARVEMIVARFSHAIVDVTLLSMGCHRPVIGAIYILFSPTPF
jgi:hypothetical protein